MTLDDIKDDILCSQWVLYKHPKDFPDRYVVREWLILTGSRIAVTQNCIISPDLEFVVHTLLARHPTLIYTPRHPSDDACIMGVYL